MSTPRPPRAQYEALASAALWSTVSDALLLLDAGTREIVHWNARAEALLGYSPTELQGLKFEAVFPDGAWPVMTDGREPLERVARTKRGEAIDVELRLCPFSDDAAPAGWVLATLRDVSERKRLEARLRAAEERAHVLSNATFEGIILHEQGTILDVNQTVCDQTGYDRDELIGRSVLDLAAPESRPAIVQRLRQGNTDPFESVTLTKDGRTIQVEIEAKDLHHAGRSVRVVAIRDVTESRRALEALQLSEERYRLVGQVTSDAIWDWDIVKDRVTWSEGSGQMFTALRESGPNVDQRIHPYDRSRVLEGIRQVLEGAGDRWSDQYRFRRKDGTYAHVLDRGCVLRDEHGKAFRMIGSMQDLTERLEAEAALKASEDRYRRLVEQSPEMIAILAQGRIVYINAAGVALLGGASPKDLIGVPILERVHPDSRTRFLRRIKERLGKGLAMPLSEQRFQRADGTSFFAEVALLPITFHGEPAVQIMVRDVSERRSLEHRLQKSKELLDEAQRLAKVGSFEAMVDPPTVHWSDELYRIFGLEPGQALATMEALIEALHPDDRERFLAAQPTFRPGSHLLGEFRIVRPDGEVRTILSQGQAILGSDGTPKKVFGTVQDITERKLFEEQQLQNEALKRSNALKDQFLSIVSHELRTPLTAIKGAASVLTSGKAGPLTDKQATFLGIISNHSVRLNHLIDDVLDLSKMEAGKMTYHLAEGDLAALAREVCDGFAQVFDEKGISLELEVLPVWSRFDPDKLAQVLSNLLSNASKFTKQGGSVVVRVQEHDGQAVLEVEDDGIGIPLEHQAQLFSKFYQVDSTETRKVGGTGLGLAICKTIVEDGHGGTIGLESQVGRGTTFFVRLPLASNRMR